VLKLAWDAPPPELLAFLLSVEEKQGRTREVALGPRTLDLDILLFDALILESPDLTIPHPRLHERKFALIPCLEIDPGLVHPRLKRPLAEFVGQIGDEQRIERYRTVPAELLRRMGRDSSGGPAG
jgi:2-amino-4-hydroxy-6-hydroxymethyldihydropteridine diphosphokinase